MWDKIVQTGSSAIKYVSKVLDKLDGKKRRISVIAGIVFSFTPAHTVANQIAQTAMYLFGGADILQLLNKKKKQP